MSFSSLIALGFLIMSLAVAWLLPSRWQARSVGLCGAAFLGLASPVSLLFLAVSSPLVYLSAKKSPGRISILLATIGGLATISVGFKYRAAVGANAIVPLGISFSIFRMIHYVLESSKRSLRDHDLGDYLSYLFFMPALLVGPIHRFPEFLRDLRRRRFDRSVFLYGLQRVYYGYAKVVILSSFLPSHWMPHGWETCSGWVRDWGITPCLDWLTLYVQFSGYSDIAIGAAAMCGFRIIENFRWPFLASNISDFWRRWHISLTSWCRDYVYLPIGALTRNRTLSMISAMLVIGLWHEFSLRYVLWGFYHAGGIVVYNRYARWMASVTWSQNPYFRIVSRIAGTLVTLTFVVLSYPITQRLDQGIQQVWAWIAF